MKKKIINLISIILISSLMITNVNAREVTKADENVTQEGKYESTRFIAGNRVIDSAEVDGLTFVAGNEITLEGSAPYGFYAGNLITIKEKIEKDIFVAGNNIIIEKEAEIGRDIYIAGNSITIKANIKRDLRAGCSSVNLSGVVIGGDAFIEAEEIILDKDTVIVGKLTYPSSAKITGIDTASIGSTKVNKRNKNNIEVTESLKDKISKFITSTVAAFITMMTILFLIPSSKEKLNNIELKIGSILKIMGIGLIVLIVVPIISIIALFTGILTPLALITLAIYTISIYLSSLLVYYIVGKILDEKLIKQNKTYLTLLCGIVIVKIIKLIPFIGGLITAITLFYGIGLIYQFIASREK